MHDPIDVINERISIMKIERKKAGCCVECGEKPINKLSPNGWCEFCEDAFKLEFPPDE
jgi:hypothetical protein